MKLISWSETRLAELVDLWNKEFFERFPMRTELYQQNSFKDNNVCWNSSCIAVDDQNQVIGFIVAKRWQEKLHVKLGGGAGWIQVLIVDKASQGKGIGSTLLHHAERGLRRAGVKQILLGRDPYHYFPGIPEEQTDAVVWFERRGYQNSGKEFDLLHTYEQGEGKSIPEIAGVEFSLIQEDEKDELIDFLNRVFPGRWEYEAIHYFQKGGTGREFVVVKKAGKIIGFCRINDPQSPFIAQNVYWSPLMSEDLGGAGPLGVDEKERGNGYGLAIVEAGIAFLRQRGIRNIVIDWTGLVDFYHKLGYETWKTYLSYSKKLSD